MTTVGAARKKLKRVVTTMVATICLNQAIRKATGEATIEMLCERILQSLYDAEHSGGTAVTLDDEEPDEGVAIPTALRTPAWRPLYWLTLMELVIVPLWDASVPSQKLDWRGVHKVWVSGESTKGAHPKVKTEAGTETPGLLEQQIALGVAGAGLGSSASRRALKAARHESLGTAEGSSSSANVGAALLAAIATAVKERSR